MWQVLLGSAIALVSTLLAQWFSLSYQTKRQREMRWADFKRTDLLQLRDALKELGLCLTRVFISQGEVLERTGTWETFSSLHPQVAEVSGAVTPVLIQQSTIEDEPLRLKLETMTETAEIAAKAPSERDAVEQRDLFFLEFREVIDYIGDQLRRLS
jgi:hypothetical protein